MVLFSNIGKGQEVGEGTRDAVGIFGRQIPKDGIEIVICLSITGTSRLGKCAHSFDQFIDRLPFLVFQDVTED